MKSLLSRLRMHWDQEPWKAPASRTHSKRFAKSRALGHRAAAFGVRGACFRFRTRFMESAHGSHRITVSPTIHGKARGNLVMYTMAVSPSSRIFSQNPESACFHSESGIASLLEERLGRPTWHAFPPQNPSFPAPRSSFATATVHSPNYDWW